MTNLVFLRDGQAVTTSEAIASGVSVQHKNLLSILRNYQSDFETFGVFAFETRKLSNPLGGRPETYAILNEQQATLLVTYCKNTEVVRRFKVALVKAFCEAKNPQTLTAEEQFCIQQAVAKRAQKNRESFQAIYRAIKTRYRIPKYSLLPRSKFEECLKFVETLSLTVPEKPEEHKQSDKKTFTVTEDFLERMQTFVYCWRYLFRKDLERFTDFLYSVNSPYAPHFWEAVHDLHLALLERNLEKLGFGPKDLDCYKFWAKTNSNLLGCADRFE